MDLTFASQAQLRKALDAKQISAVELAQAALDRIAALSPSNTNANAQAPSGGLNAMLDVQAEPTLAQARRADALIAAGNAGPLTGIPITHKDIFVTRNWRSTAGSRMLADYTSPFDATVVARLEQAGAVCLGKTNCDEFAMGGANENSYFGPARNPWDPSRVPGGSSGGAAVSVAAGLSCIATGTDTGGSVRQPAALCGITGLKPSYGRVSRWGMIAFASSLDQAGPMAHSAHDCALALNVMAGFDERDSTSLTSPAEDYTRLLGVGMPEGSPPKPLYGLRIGVPRDYFGPGLSAEVADAVNAALQVYVGLGAQLVEITLPRTELSIPAYYVIAPAEASSNLSRYDGVRYGYRAADYQDLNSMYCQSRSQGFGDEVKRRILVGAYVLSHGYYDAYYLKAQKLRRLIAQDFAQAFTQCDVIMGPVSPTVAWEIGAITADPVANYLADIYTLGASLAGLPGLSLPCGYGQGEHQHLPIGLQVIAPYGAEAQLLSIGDWFQHVTDWHQRHPRLGSAPSSSSTSNTREA